MDELRGVTEIERDVIIEYLLVNLSVLLHNKGIVPAANQQYIPDSPLHQKLEGGLSEYIPHGLHHSLGQHGLGHLDESADIGSVDIIDEPVFPGSVFHACGMNILHDSVQPVVNLFA